MFNNIISFAIVVLIAIIALSLVQLYINTHSDPISLKFQHYESSTRHPLESPVMSNVLSNNIQNSINLIDGLKLRVPNKNYKFRCGNFLDILDLICTHNTDISYKQIGKLFSYFNQRDEEKIVIALVYDISSPNGLLTLMECLRCLLQLNLKRKKNSDIIHELILLDSIPRSKDIINQKGITHLVLDDLKDDFYLNGSETWYKKVVVMSKNFNSKKSNIVSIDYLMEGIKFLPFVKDEIITEDNYLLLDNSRLLEYKDTIFTQNNLVSAVSSFLTTLPQDMFITEKDECCFLIDSINKSFNNIQLIYKVLSLLMLGANVKFSKIDEINDDLNISNKTTFLQTNSENVNKLLSLTNYQQNRTKFMFKVFHTLLLDNFYMSSKKFSYVNKNLHNLKALLITTTEKKTISSEIMSLLKTNLQCRASLETYIDLSNTKSIKLLGPLFYTNFYDHRHFKEKMIERTVTFAGAVYPSLQFKIVDKLEDTDSIGKLKIRGFTIGTPIDGLKEQYKEDMENNNANEGWVKLEGIEGCIGRDSCFWISKVNTSK
ncbi:uncharacterized protein HGUI_01941 [Hanseniaspora guilliermondii]|uniref:Uncharacterized protein n=1 Tax=Hanseniaspora guilliermondii TaxID=56406 RepID=A0A1L0CLH7_9ASCO|nr:uncharacterized protein HGUI_01941 [Hanseniaspora guilliermondii]